MVKISPYAIYLAYIVLLATLFTLTGNYLLFIAVLFVTNQ